MSLYNKLYDIPFRMTEKQCKNGAKMIRLDFGEVEKYPSDEPGTRSYNTCIGMFIKDKCITVGFYTQIFFRPMKGKKPTTQKEVAKWRYINRNQPMISKMVYGQDRIVFAPTKKNNIFRFMHFNDRKRRIKYDAKTKAKKVVKGAIVVVKHRRLHENTVKYIEGTICNYVQKLVETKYKYEKPNWDTAQLAINIGTAELLKALQKEIQKKGWQQNFSGKGFNIERFPITKPKIDPNLFS